MEPTYDSRRTEDAAAEKTAVTGGNGTKEAAKNGTVQSGAPRSWRQYIEQTLPAGDTTPAAQPREADLLQFAPAPKKRTKSAWERFSRRTARWARENGKKARSFAGAAREKLVGAADAARKKLAGAAAVCGEKLGGAAAACGKKLNAAAAACGKKLGPAADACGKKLGPAVGLCGKKLSAAAAVCGKKLGPVAIACRDKLSPAAAVCRDKLNSAADAARRKFGPGAEKVRDAVARHPVSPLLYVTLLAVFLGIAAFQGNYARAYVLEVNGQTVGLVSSADEADAILSSVEYRAANLLGDDFDYDVEVTLSPVFAAPGDLTDAAELEAALFEDVEAYATAAIGADPEDEEPVEVQPTSLTAWVLSVDGTELGIAASKDVFYQMLDEIAQSYLPRNSVRYEFVEDVRVYPVEMPLNTRFDSLEPIREQLSSLRVEEAVYVVKKGDTFNAIAYSLGMQPDDLAALNPGIRIELLMIDQELIIQQSVPQLSVMAVTEEIYEQIISSPIEYIETADLYVGDTKVKTQGEDGLALVNAQVTYLNNKEVDREVLESTTLKEPTTTYVYTGTTPRPKTASKGYFIWPVNGSISSSYGYRHIFGGYSFHGGLDIYVPSGTSVKAADGGTVVNATWDNSYGYYVSIRHDNGLVTLYAHNSKLLVKAGDKVYQGQIIAKSGATGHVTGPHCHFEVRVNGTRVNPRNYL